MSRCRFVQPDVVRVTLTDGDFLDVKRELNTGEQRRVFSGMVRDGFTPGEKTVLVPEKCGLTKVLEYLVGWSFTDVEGRPVPVSESALNNLDPESYAEIVLAIDAHEDAQFERRETERKNRIGATGSKAISESVAP